MCELACEEQVEFWYRSEARGHRRAAAPGDRASLQRTACAEAGRLPRPKLQGEGLGLGGIWVWEESGRRAIMCGTGRTRPMLGPFGCSSAWRQGTGLHDPKPCHLAGLDHVPRVGSLQGARDMETWCLVAPSGGRALAGRAPGALGGCWGLWTPFYT